MPIRLTCPSCSATLSVKDEYAGRAVKCPKCGGVIPASPPAAPAAPPAAAASLPPPEPASPPPPPPAPAAEKAPFEELDEPAKPAKGGAKITGKPVASKAKDEDEEDDERPRRKGKDRDEDDDERPRRKGRDEDEDAKSKKRDRDDKDEDDRDRPKRKRRGDEDDDDGPPRGRRGKPEKKGGSNTALILGIVAVCLLGCCGGIGYGVYYLIQKGKEGVENVQKQFNLAENFAKVRVGSTTRAEAEALFGPGQPATMDELKKAYTVGGVPEGWNKLIGEGRALMWVKGDDRVFMAFYPNGNADSKVQRKNLVGKYVGSASEGELDDAAFLARYQPGKKPGGDPVKPPTGTPGGGDEEPPAGPLTEVKAEELAQEFKDNEGEATSKYKDKWLVVEGKVHDVTSGPPTDDGADTVMLKLIGIKTPNGRGDLGVWCYVKADDPKKPWDTARGQTVKIKGKCSGGGVLQTNVGLKNARIEGKNPDPAISVSALVLVGEFLKDTEAANEKYKDKEVVISGARFVSLSPSNDLVVFTGPAKGALIRLQANFNFGQRKKLEQLKPGQVVKFRARAGSLFGTDPNKVVSFYDAYLVP